MGRVQVLFPGVRAEVEVKVFFACRTAWSFGELVEGRGLAIRKTAWQLQDRCDFIVEDRLLIDCGSYDAEPFGSQQIDQRLQFRLIEPSNRTRGRLHRYFGFSECALGVWVLEKIEQLQAGGHEPMREPQGDPAVEILAERRVLQGELFDRFDGDFQEFRFFDGFCATGHRLLGKEGRPSDQFAGSDTEDRNHGASGDVHRKFDQA